MKLQAYNTFGINVKAEQFIVLKEEKQLIELTQSTTNTPIKILGGGSNILLTQDVKGILLKNEIKGINIVEENEKTVLVAVGAGEIWHDFVLYAIKKNWGGIENLSLIPGTCGAAPIQNIGAYGVELKDVFEHLEAIDLVTGKKHFFNKKQCDFGYRNSIFKQEWKGKLCITKVYFKLQKPPHSLQLSYGIIAKILAEKKITSPTIKDVSETVIQIRQAKLPAIDKLGNSGSFFKNPIIPSSLFNTLQKKYPNIPHYPISEKQVKIPAAWLIDQCGFKGVRHGNTGCYENQPLVLVNYGQATGLEILDFSRSIQQKVKHRFDIQLQLEVNIW